MNIPDAAVQAAKRELRYSTGDWEHDIYRALTAALPHLPLGYEVKKLEWDKNSEKEEWYGGAQNELVGINEYNIFAHPCATGLFVLDVMGNRCEDDFTSVETAKAAAQADFERRVRECIVAKPSDYAKPDFYAVHSKSGMHIGLWPNKANADEALLEYEGGKITPLFTKPVDVDAVRRQAFEEAVTELEINWPHIATTEMRDAIRSLSAESALKGQQHDK